MSTQDIRPSQFITTYGPGAIIEATGGPGVLRDLGSVDIFRAHRPTDFEIPEPRLSRLLGGAGFVRIPTNAELGQPAILGTYAANSFPNWSLCVTHGVLYQQAGRPGCPRCSDQSDRKARREAVRFVRACGDGHLDDVDWPHLVSHRTEGCRPAYMLWVGGGGALRNISVVCPDCEAPANLGRAYAVTHSCSGRFPEQGPQRPGCDKPARILQRGAANLRVADVVSALTIPETDTRLHQLLATQIVRAALLAPVPTTHDEIIQRLSALVENGLLRAAMRDEISHYSAADVLRAFSEVQQASVAAQAGTGFRNAELIQLEKAAADGAPPQSRGSNSQRHFEVRLSDTRFVNLTADIQLRVAAVSRLKIVNAQTSYRRLVNSEPEDNRPVSVALSHPDRDWLPAVELFGEGVFVDAPGVSAETLLGLGIAAQGWSLADRSTHADHIQALAPADSASNEIHPLYVWWHTLGHRLMRALALDSGYGSAALRERVYANVDPDLGRIRGGVLIYTAQPGGDGTLGGLVSSTRRFETILSNALDGLDHCSNDPLCSEQHFALGNANGAACYACLLLSETSCEMRNMSLDRHIITRGCS